MCPPGTVSGLVSLARLKRSNAREKARSVKSGGGDPQISGAVGNQEGSGAGIEKSSQFGAKVVNWHCQGSWPVEMLTSERTKRVQESPRGEKCTATGPAHVATHLDVSFLSLASFLSR